MIDIGEKINSWTYLGEPNNRKQHYGSFQCDCGETKTMIEWCEMLGVPHGLPNNRWKRGVRGFDELFSLVDRRKGVLLHY